MELSARLSVGCSAGNFSATRPAMSEEARYDAGAGPCVASLSIRFVSDLPDSDSKMTLLAARST